MGSLSLKIGDGTARFTKSTLSSSASNILMIICVITTNLFALYAFTSSSPKSPFNHPLLHSHHTNFSLISHQISLILKEIASSQKKLAQMETELVGYNGIDLSKPNISNELKHFLKPHNLPLGKDSKTGITQMEASVGHFCEKSSNLLSQFMNYRVYGPCPDDLSLAQKLILQKCEPLPRRRCLACLKGKNFSKFMKGNHNNGYEEENHKFTEKGLSKNDFLIDDVMRLAMGGIRIGLDIYGSGSFAAIMAQRNITVITITLNNKDTPFSEFIAAKGLFPLFLSLDHRFPFYDNVFDLVRGGGSELDDVEGKAEKFEFFMFDVDRILRPGGLLWLDNLHCKNYERKIVITRLIERFGYKKLKWAVGEKVDDDSVRSAKSHIVLLSALLQKPTRL